MANEAPKRFTKMDASNLARQLGIDLNEIDINEFTAGLNVELEHGKVNPKTNVTNDDPVVTAKIAWAHLNEVKNYYTLLSEYVEQGEDNNPSQYK
jgi:hypothetical protein